MSDSAQGPGWWQASDGKWYPPEPAAAATPPPPPGGGTDVIDVGGSISYGWEAFKKYPGQLIAAFIIVWLITGVVSALAGFGGGDSLVLSLLLNVVSWVVALVLAKGLVTIALDVTHGRDVDLGKLFSGEHLGQYLLGSIIVGVLVGLGLILCIIPGLFIAVAWQFTPYRIIDRGETATEALSGSWELVKPQFWSLVGLLLALAGINLIGALLCLVGLLVTVPLSAVAVAHAYRTASGQVPAPV